MFINARVLASRDRFVTVNPRQPFAISLLLNLALAGLAAWLLSRPRGGAVAEERSAAPAAVSPTASGLPSLVATTSAPTFNFTTNRFAWGKVESDDFERLAANLRTLGCPEKTVHDVVLARARRALKRLVNHAGPPVPFWTVGRGREQANHEAETAARVAREKIITSVERVTGAGRFVEDPDIMDDYVGQAIVRFVAGPMSEATFSQLTLAFARNESQRSEIKSRAQGVLLDEDEAALADGHRQLHLELAVALTPAELNEFIARSSMMGLADQIVFEATDLATAEIRELALLRSQVRDPFGEDFIFGGSPSDEEQQQFYALARQRFGEARFAQLERAADDDFQTLFRLGRENDLPRDAAAKAFELRQLAGQEAARMREDNSLGAAERQQRLATMQAETQEAVLKVLGAEACAQYLNQGGAWVTNWSGL